MLPAHPVYTLRVRYEEPYRDYASGRSYGGGWITSVDRLNPDGSTLSDSSPFWPSEDGPFDTREEAVAWELRHFFRTVAVYGEAGVTA